MYLKLVCRIELADTAASRISTQYLHILSTFLCLVFVRPVPAVNDIAVLSAANTRADGMRASLGVLPTMLLFPPSVSFAMLGVAAILSIFKPWQRTPLSRAGSFEPAGDR
jgi:hypothetical protein